MGRNEVLLLKIAVSGKGGVGKTTVAAGLIKIIVDQGYKVFAVDADPDVSLGTLLGFPAATINDLKPIVEMRDLIAEKVGGSGSLFTLNPEVDDLVQDFTLQKDKLLFLKMGAIKQGGSACYCRENSVLNALIAKLLVREQEYVILDMGAGIEHLTRGTAEGVDTMIIVTEPSRVSVNTARVVKKLALEIGIKEVKFIGNKIRTIKEEKFLADELTGEDILGFLPFSDQVLDEAMEGTYASGSYISPELKAIAHKIIDK